jgi:hypothetical protein
VEIISHEGASVNAGAGATHDGSGSRHALTDAIREYIARNTLGAYQRLLGGTAKKIGAEFYFHCPFHSDGKRPNLRVNPDKTRWYCDVCDAGGDLFDLYGKLNGVEFSAAREALAGLFGLSTNGKRSTVAKIVATYDYVGQDGKLLYQVCRYQPKNFKQRTPDNNGGWTWQNRQQPIPYRLPELLASDPDEWCLKCNGEKAVDAAREKLGFVATCNSGGEAKWTPALNTFFDQRRIAIVVDNDDTGEKDLRIVVANLSGHAREVRALRLPGLPPKGDIVDWIEAGGRREALLALIELAPQVAADELAQNHESQSDGGQQSQAKPGDEWADPEPINGKLPDVRPITPDMLPEALRARAVDIARRMSAPLEYVAEPMIVEAAALIGLKLAIRPKAKDDWIVFPNMWGGVIGPPGDLKTPAHNEALQPIRVFQKHENQKVQDLKGFGGVIHKLKKEKLEKQLKEAVNSNKDAADYRAEYETLESEFRARKYEVNDSSVPKLHEQFAANPHGLLLVRDELSGWLASLDREGSESDRAFFLECFEPGVTEFAQDRIGRGDNRAVRMLSVTGGFTPDPLAHYLTQTFKHGRNDGLVQRLQLLMYPDRKEWDGGVDEEPDPEARTQAEAVFRALKDLDPEGFSVWKNEDSSLHWVRFAADAQEAFTVWRDKLERRIRDPQSDDSPILIQHLSKSRSLLPKLALIFHTCEVLAAGDRTLLARVCVNCEQMAERWCECLETHARRLYFHVTQRDENAAWELAQKIRQGRLSAVFSAREVKQKHWKALDESTVPDAIEQLVDANWIAPLPVAPGPKMGRPSPKYCINPKVRQ